MRRIAVWQASGGGGLSKQSHAKRRPCSCCSLSSSPNSQAARICKQQQEQRQQEYTGQQGLYASQEGEAEECEGPRRLSPSVCRARGRCAHGSAGSQGPRALSYAASFAAPSTTAEQLEYAASAYEGLLSTCEKPTRFAVAVTIGGSCQAASCRVAEALGSSIRGDAHSPASSNTTHTRKNNNYRLAIDVSVGSPALKDMKRQQRLGFPSDFKWSNRLGIELMSLLLSCATPPYLLYILTNSKLLFHRYGQGVPLQDS